MQSVSKYAMSAAMVLGIGMVVTGAVFVFLGLDAKADIRQALLKENIVTSKDAPFPGVLVQDAATARAQQDAIEGHTFGEWGHYSGMDREDPNRDTYLKGLTLRNSLNLAVLGFGVADLALGTGMVSIVLGLAVTGIAVTLFAMVRQLELQAVREPAFHPVPVPADG